MKGEFNLHQQVCSSSFSSTSPAIRIPKWVLVWTQLDNDVSFYLISMTAQDRTSL